MEEVLFDRVSCPLEDYSLLTHNWEQMSLLAFALKDHFNLHSTKYI